MIVPKGAAIALLIEKRAEAERRHSLQLAGRLAVEPQEVAQHQKETGTDQVAPLREQAVEIGASIFQAASVERDRKGHLGRLGRDTEMREKCRQVWVGGLIEDDEPGVDGLRTVAAGDIDRVGVPAETRCALEDGDTMPLAEKPRRRHARDAGADHRDIEFFV